MARNVKKWLEQLQINGYKRLEEEIFICSHCFNNICKIHANFQTKCNTPVALTMTNQNVAITMAKGGVYNVQ